MSDGLARLFGVYEVKGQRPAEEVSLPEGFLYPEMQTDGIYYYDLRKLEGFGDLENRVVIDWGRSPLSWHQWLQG